MQTMQTPAQAQPARPAAARLPDWQTRLAALVAQRMRHPFIWGVHDCCLFAADAVLACTGQDLAADLRGTYSTQAQAGELLAARGGIIKLASGRLGRVTPPALAQAGDVALADMGDGYILAVCGGAHFLAPGPAGLVPLQLHQVRRAWRCTTAAEVAHG